MRDKRIETQATPEEYELFRVAAERAGLQIAAWLRMVAVKAAREGS